MPSLSLLTPSLQIRESRVPGSNASMWKLKMPQSAVMPAVTIASLATLGGLLIASTQLYIVEQYICHDYYVSLKPEMLGGGGRIDESLCKEPAIQSSVASFQGTYTFLIFTPALFLAGPWGQLSRILGKKTVVFLNGCSAVMETAYYMGISYYPQYFSIRLLWLSPLFNIIGGGPIILNSLVYTYVAESYESRDLARVLYRFTALQLLNGFLGMSLSSFLLRINVYLVLVLAITILAFIIPFSLLLPSHTRYEPISPDPLSPSSETTSLHSSFSNPKQSTASQIFHTLIGHYEHTIELFRTCFTSSALSRLTLVSFFLLTLANGIRVIFTQWASVHYTWSIADVHIITSFEMIVSGSVLLSLPPLASVLSKRLGSSSRVDILLASVSLFFAFLGLLCMATAPSRALYIVAISIYTLGAGLIDSLRSFSTRAVGGKEEVERLYIGMGLMTTIGSMISSAGWNWMFSQSVGEGWFEERGPFWGALLTSLAIGVLIRKLSRFGVADTIV